MAVNTKRAGSGAVSLAVHPLELIFKDAVAQATGGKGERHGGDAVPFYKQQWVFQAKVHGSGFLTGQASKKLTEAVGRRRIDDLDDEAYERELLGAINYLAMALLQHRQFPEA
jgi:hypothetical protein